MHEVIVGMESSSGSVYEVRYPFSGKIHAVAP